MIKVVGEKNKKTRYSHGVVEVSHHTGTLAWRGIPEARVVGIADDALHPGQRAGRGHGLVWEVTWIRTGQRVNRCN